MTTETTETTEAIRDAAPVEAEAPDDGDDLWHLVCCRPHHALCGTSVGDGETVEDIDPLDECVVCDHLWNARANCGGFACWVRQRIRDWRYR